MTQPPHEQQQSQPPAVDPDNIPETLCNGRFYLTWQGNLGTLTFTQYRPKTSVLFESDRIDDESIVRARIVMTSTGMAALRDLLIANIKASGESPTAGAAGETKH
jgi:hypothetical protein